MGQMPRVFLGNTITSRMVDLPGHEGDQAVEPRSDPAVRRGPVAERLQEEAEALGRLLVRDAQEAEDPLLQFGIMDPDGA